MRFHHIGIATDDSDSLSMLLSNLLGITVCHEERFEELEITFLALPDGYIELLEPVEAGTVSRFLDRSGPGIHHLAFGVSDIEATIASARNLGITPIDTTPRQGAWGHRVAFLHPDDTGGMLIELVNESSVE